MRVEVRAFATLARFLPLPRSGTTAFLTLSEGSTVRDVTEALGIPREMSVVVLVNGTNAYDDRVLAAEDTVTLFPPLVGG